MAPLSPSEDVPVLSPIDPLTPEDPAFDVDIRMAPLELARPSPLSRLMLPPVDD